MAETGTVTSAQQKKEGGRPKRRGGGKGPAVSKKVARDTTETRVGGAVADEVRSAIGSSRSDNASAARVFADKTPNSSVAGVSFQYHTGAMSKGSAESVPSAVGSNVDNSSSNGPESIHSGDKFEYCRQVGKYAGGNMAAIDLIGYVRTELFPKLKFIMDKRQLVYSGEKGTICALICKDMSVKDSRAADWWETHKLLIMKTLNSKRADVTAAIKRTFVSK
jgi:hypothetical protein